MARVIMQYEAALLARKKALLDALKACQEVEYQVRVLGREYIRAEAGWTLDGAKKRVQDMSKLELASEDVTRDVERVLALIDKTEDSHERYVMYENMKIVITRN